MTSPPHPAARSGPDRLLLMVIVLGLSVILAIDWLTPRGDAGWILYFVPLLLSAWTSKRHLPLVLAAVSTVLVVIGFLVSPPGVKPTVDIIERGTGVATLWIVAALLWQRKGTDERLRASEGRFRSIVTAMNEGFVLQQSDGTIIDCNAQAGRILGLSRDQVLGRTSRDPRWHAVREDGRPFPGEEHPAMITLRTGRPCQHVVMGLHLPDGTLRWININAEPVLQEGADQPHGAVTTFTDITERRQEEQVVRESEASLRRAERIAQAGHWSRDMSSGEIQCSEGIWRIYGFESRSEKLSMAMLVNRVHPADRQMFSQEIQEALAGIRPYELDYRIVWTDGTIRWLHASAEVSRDAKGQPTRMFGVTIDITERREAAELLRQKNAELQATLAEVKTLSGMLPICSGCKKIRDDQNYWHQVETYIGSHSEATFTHGMCPDCIKVYFPDIDLSKPDRNPEGAP